MKGNKFMIKLRNKILAPSIALMTLISSTAPVFAADQAESTLLNKPDLSSDLNIQDESDAPYIYSYSRSEEEVSRDLQNQIDKEVEQLQREYSKTRVARSTGSGINPNNWKTEYGKEKMITLSGYSGNQLPGGRRFTTGGGFYFSDSGGPSVSGSISYAAPFSPISVSVSLGNSSNKGEFVTVPNRKDFFKLYVSKDVKVKPYKTYTRANSSSPWKVYYNGKVQSTYRSTSYARKV